MSDREDLAAACSTIILRILAGGSQTDPSGELEKIKLI